MKKKIVLIIALLSILMMGCTKEFTESTFVEDGKKALESYDYSNAMKLLSNALEENSGDEYARAMYMQAMRMLSVEEYKEQTNYKKAIEELETIASIKNGSSVIKDKASKDLKEMKSLYEEQQAAEAKRKEDAKTSASKAAYQANQQIIKAEEEAKKEEEEEIEEELGNEQNNTEAQTPNNEVTSNETTDQPQNNTPIQNQNNSSQAPVTQ